MQEYIITVKLTKSWFDNDITTHRKKLNIPGHYQTQIGDVSKFHNNVIGSETLTENLTYCFKTRARVDLLNVIK